jgi:hypothetical protein
MGKRISKNMPYADKGSAGFQLRNAGNPFPLFATNQAPGTMEQVIRHFTPSRRVNALFASKLIHRAVFPVALAPGRGRRITLTQARSHTGNGNLIFIRKPASLELPAGAADSLRIPLSGHDAGPPFRSIGHDDLRVPRRTEVLP